MVNCEMERRMPSSRRAQVPGGLRVKKTVSPFVFAILLAASPLALPLGFGPSARAATGPYIFDLLKKPAYRAAWRRMLKGRRAPLWVRQVSGPGGPSKIVRIGGQAYRLADVCKAHDCGDNQFRVLFSRNGKQAWGAMKVAGRKIRYFGRPSTGLRRYLAAAFRR